VDKETARAEAFSDGVFAIAITLLILNIQVPHNLPGSAGLAEALLSQWPSYLAFLIGFTTILVVWINHHRMFDLIRRSNNILLLLNGIVLLGVTIVPFPTALLAEYIQRPDRSVALFIYGCTFMLIGVSMNLVWWYASHGYQLIQRSADSHAVKTLSVTFRFGLLYYSIAFGVSLVSALAGLVMYGLLFAFFAVFGVARQSRLDD
jgi:uncharacterized membrane protein